MDLALEPALEGVLDHALDRREAGGAGDEDDRPLGFAQAEVADRALEADSSPSFIASKTCVVKRPPGISRICSSTNSASCGGLANEKARRWPSSRMMLIYCPALKLICWPSGSLSRTRMTSWVSFSILTTRALYSWKPFWRRARLVLDLDVFECRGAAHQHLALRQFCADSALGW
jgi:hypothetical protein